VTRRRSLPAPSGPISGTWPPPADNWPISHQVPRSFGATLSRAVSLSPPVVIESGTWYRPTHAYSPPFCTLLQFDAVPFGRLISLSPVDVITKFRGIQLNHPVLRSGSLPRAMDHTN
jgi:hypothetical protein